MATTLPSITRAPYVLERERKKPEADRTTFTLQPLDGLQSLDVNSLGYVNYRLALTIGLKDWSNLKDESGQLVKFSIDNFSKVQPEDLLDIACEIIERSSLSEEQRKNS